MPKENIVHKATTLASSCELKLLSELKNSKPSVCKQEKGHTTGIEILTFLVLPRKLNFIGVSPWHT